MTVELADRGQRPAGVGVGIRDHAGHTVVVELDGYGIGGAQDLRRGGIRAERGAGEGDRLLGRHDSSELMASSTSERASSTEAGTTCSV